LNTNRLETFADGVFAIAATLLILNVDAQVSEDVLRHAQREDASGCLSCAWCDRGCRWDVSQLSIDWGGVQRRDQAR
jgi:hypothetical protein